MTNSDDLYGMELDRRLTAERALTAVVEVVEAYESCGPKQQSTRDVLAAVRAAFECSALHGLDYRAAFYRVWERCEELKTSVAEHQYNALEMARKADQAERRAEEAEFHVEQLRDALERAERRVERVERLAGEWEADYPSPLAACSRESDEWWRDLRFALDGGVS